MSVENKIHFNKFINVVTYPVVLPLKITKKVCVSAYKGLKFITIDAPVKVKNKVFHKKTNKHNYQQFGQTPGTRYEEIFSPSRFKFKTPKLIKKIIKSIKGRSSSNYHRDVEVTPIKGRDSIDSYKDVEAGGIHGESSGQTVLRRAPNDFLGQIRAAGGKTKVAFAVSAKKESDLTNPEGTKVNGNQPKQSSFLDQIKKGVSLKPVKANSSKVNIGEAGSRPHATISFLDELKTVGRKNLKTIEQPSTDEDGNRGKQTKKGNIEQPFSPGSIARAASTFKLRNRGTANEQEPSSSKEESELERKLRERRERVEQKENNKNK